MAYEISIWRMSLLYKWVSGEFESNQLVIKAISLPGSLLLLMHAAKGLKTSFVLDAHRVYPVQNIIMYYSYIVKLVLKSLKGSVQFVQLQLQLKLYYSQGK